MTRKAVLGLTAAILMAFVGVARADVWDTGTTPDGSKFTPNEVVPGSDQTHDFLGGTSDQDWYRLRLKPYSSYEVLIEGVSGNAATGILFARLDSDGTTILTTSGGTISATARSYRFDSGTATMPTDNFLRVTSGNCGSTCNASDTYRIRVYETTYAIARFNNSGTQITTLLIQNRSEASITITGRFFSATGALLTTTPDPWTATIPARGSAVVNTSASSPGLAGLSGSVLVMNNGRYGDLVGKTVALEPATGFSFDTLMEPTR
jgi:hypothetical protein